MSTLIQYSNQLEDYQNRIQKLSNHLISNIQIGSSDAKHNIIDLKRVLETFQSDLNCLDRELISNIKSS